MRSANETSDPAVLLRYKKPPTLRQTEQENRGLICPYCQKPKHQVGRFWVCACSGKNIRLTTGKPIKRNKING